MRKFFVLSVIIACSQDLGMTAKRTAQDYADLVESIPYCTGQDTDPKNCIENWCTGDIEIDPEDCVPRPQDKYRIDGAIGINNDYCICANGVPLINNNCTTFCSDKMIETATLYATAYLKAKSSNFANLHEWCNKEMGEEVSPACKLELRSETGATTYLDISLTGDNTFTADVRSIGSHRYVASIIEENSLARSLAIHLMKVQKDVEQYRGPLKMVGVSMYSCISRKGTSNTSDVNGYQYAELTDFFRMHFFFANNSIADPLPPAIHSRMFLYCHDPDLNKQGYADRSSFNRLEQVKDQFFLWDKSDIMTYDLSGDGMIDVNSYIRDYLLSRYNQSIGSTVIFKEFRWPKLPIQVDNTVTETSPIIGFFMQPWVDQNSDRKTGFCPDEYHYNGTNPLFRELGNIIGTPTEALYVAESEPTLVAKSDGSVDAEPYRDVMFIRESVLKKIWFYREYDGDKYLYFIPDNKTASQKTIQFYWPPFNHNDNAFFQRPGQLLYTIKNITNLYNSMAEEESVRTDYGIPDKRFACVPKGGNEPILR